MFHHGVASRQRRPQRQVLHSWTPGGGLDVPDAQPQVGVGHVGSWNVDQARYERALADFIS
ncbi:hypothetical protein GCM10018965_008210 [Nonomuraea roseola]